MYNPKRKHKCFDQISTSTAIGTSSDFVIGSFSQTPFLPYKMDVKL